MIYELTRSMMPKEIFEHRDKVEAFQIIPEYIKIQRKESDLSRSQRHNIVAKFNRLKNKGLYSDLDLQKIEKKINEQI